MVPRTNHHLQWRCGKVVTIQPNLSWLPHSQSQHLWGGCSICTGDVPWLLRHCHWSADCSHSPCQWHSKDHRLTLVMQVTIFCLIGRRSYWNGLWLLPDHFHLRATTRSLMVAPWSRAHLIDLELWYFAYRSWALQPARLGLSYCTRFDKIS